MYAATGQPSRTIFGMERWHEKARRLLIQQDKKIKDLAAHLDVTASAAGHWLAGRRSPDPGQLKKIANFLGISVSELIENDPDFARNSVEKAILEEFRKLPPEIQAQAVAVVKALAPSVDPPASTEDT